MRFLASFLSLGLALAALPTHPLAAQRPTPEAVAEAAASPTSLVELLYNMASFPPGPEPDWDMFRDVFLDNAVIVFAPSPSQPMRPLSVDGFIADWEAFWRDSELEDKGFYESIGEMSVTEFGGLAHAWVVFLPQVGPDPPARQIRGLDSIELAFDGTRWWIAAITTDWEIPGRTIPDIGG